MQKTKALPANPEHKHEVKTAVNPTVGFWAGPLSFCGRCVDLLELNKRDPHKEDNEGHPLSFTEASPQHDH